MSFVPTESWVAQQYREVGFGKDGRSGFKKYLISQNPNHELKIRQLVNAMDVTATLPKAPPVPKPVTTTSSASQTSGTVTQKAKSTQQAPATTASTSQTSGTVTQKAKSTQQAPATVVSHKSTTYSQTSDSGFESDQQIDAQEVVGSHKALHAGPGDGGVFLLSPSKGNQTAEKEGMTSEIHSNPRILELKHFLNQADGLELTLDDERKDPTSLMKLHLELLGANTPTEASGEDLSGSDSRNAVLFPGHFIGSSRQDDYPQYGLLAKLDLTDPTTTSDPRLFLNTNIPFSAFVCGVQGSGKSHTTACMIENCLIPSPALGVLQKPLSALVFNFAEYTSLSSFRPCELAFLASSASQGPGGHKVKNVNVLVSPSNYPSLVALYTQIPGVTVQPFKLRPKDLNISTMLTLMSVDQTQSTPLYMGIVTKILRGMASESLEGFNYPEFRRRLDDAGLDRKQEEFLKQRLDLLESFLDLDGSTTSPVFSAGEITIIDLSCPFVDASTACVLFKIGLGLYLESDSTVGKVVVLDEAHKYMTDTPASKSLTESLMGVIRQQRHYGARVIISTQEPSISPKLIDLCSITVMHRFSSPEWLDVLQKHILIADEEGDRRSKVSLLREIMRLRTGEALVFAPSAIFGGDNDEGNSNRRSGADELLKMRMRKRVTWDGGRSIVCV